LPLVGVDAPDGPRDRAQERGIGLCADAVICHPGAMKESGRYQAAAGLLGHGDPRLLQHGRLEIAAHQPGESLGGIRGGGTRGDSVARDRTLQHLEAGVSGAVAIVQGYQLARASSWGV
jgi:hypothetical protein